MMPPADRIHPNPGQCSNKIRSVAYAKERLLKSKVEPHSQFPQDSMFGIDGRYLLHAVIWPPDATYDKICNSYVSYVRHHFGLNTVVVFDGYENSNSTKQANKSQLIGMIIKKFQHHRVNTRQADADVDSLIASTGLTLAKSKKKPVVIIGTDIDLPVILVSEATSEMNFHFCGTNPLIVHDIQAIQKVIGNIRTYLMTLRAITGCDTTLALFSHGKKKAFLLAQTDRLDVLEVFENHGAPKRTLLVLERNSFSRFMVLVQFKHSTNTVTHATT